jgi:DNA-binding response OmpR family regulator
MHNHRAHNILIVEDDILLATDLKKNLISQGWRVSGIAKNYDTAIDMMKKADIDLAIIDLKLDGPEDGIMTARQIVKMKWIPIIYITGSNPYEIKQRMRETFPAAFLEKPLRARELSMQIDLALNNFEEGLIGNPNRKQASSVLLPTENGMLNIEESEIIYLKAEAKKTRLFLTKKELQRHGYATDSVMVAVKFGKLSSQLSTHFFKLGRSETINLNHIQKIWHDNLYLTSQTIIIPEGRRQKLLDQVHMIER